MIEKLESSNRLNLSRELFMTSIILAPNGRWSARQQTGVAAVNGWVFTYQNQTRIPKTVYQDPAGFASNTNPIRLDSKGECNAYWDITDTFYTIEVYAANPSLPHIPGELLYSQDNYPYVSGSGGDIVVASLANNLVRNSQFTFWGGTGYLKETSETPQDTFDRLGTYETICDDFIFERSNDSATVSISRGQFNIGQTEVPASPVNYLTYTCTGTGSGETYKAISQTYQSAQTFSNQEVSIGVYLKSPTSSPITIYVTQNFGTGGSPSNDVVTLVTSDTLSSAWTQYTGTITVPSVSGKSFGTNGDDYIKLSIGLPLNAIATVSVANLQFHGQNTLPPFPYTTVNDQYKRLDAVVNEGTSMTGDFLLTISDADRQGWLMCDDETIGSSFSNATHVGNQYLQLYLLIWNKVSNTYAPIYDDAGVLTTRGSSALDDWNDDKQLNLTRVLGRTFGAKGHPTFSTTFEAEEESPETFIVTYSQSSTLHVLDTSGFPTATPVTVNTLGTLPSPLSGSNTYYAINTGSTTLKLATSAANANNNISITITTAGSGVQTIDNGLGNLQEFSVVDYLFTTASTANMPTGQQVELSTTGTLPSPLVAATPYYVVNESSTTFKLASSFENAEAGIIINLTSSGSGTHTVQGGDLLVVDEAYSFYTGSIVNVESTGTLPSPLAPDTDYFAIYADSTSFKLATSYINAINGVSILLTDTGSGTHTASINYNFSPSVGQPLGEYTHGMTELENGPHDHLYLKITASQSKPLDSGQPAAITFQNKNTSISGEGTAHNNIQPTIYTNCFLKL